MACAPPLIRCDECDVLKHKSRFAAEDIRTTPLPRISASSSFLLANQGILTCINCQLAESVPVTRRPNSVAPRSQESPLTKQPSVGDARKDDAAKAADIETDEDGFVLVELSEMERDTAEYDLCD